MTDRENKRKPGETMLVADKIWLVRTSAPTSAPSPGVAGWTYSINYGPDGEENWANLTTPKGEHVGNILTHHAQAIVQGMNSALAPATQAVPDMVLVPREPTPEMVDAGLSKIPLDGSEANDIADAWRAMIESATVSHPSMDGAK